MSQNRICLNMIVKNESKIIERCLKSVYHLIDTWCIVDTGSTDGTQDIIKEFLKDKPGELIERPWVNFGHNRNEALGLARQWGEWILLTDADMILVDDGFDKSSLNTNIDAYDVVQDNHGIRYDNFRLLNTKKEWQCIGVTHEYYSPTEELKTRGKISQLWFNDISDGGSKSDKFERDIKLLTQGLIDEPKNHRYMFYLAQSYRDTGVYASAYEWYIKCSESTHWDEEKFFSLYMAAYSLNRMGKPLEEISAAYMKAWLSRPWRIEPIFELAACYRDQKMWAHAYQLLKMCATTDYPTGDLLFITSGLYEGTSIDEFAIACFWAGKFDESIACCKKLLDSDYGKKHAVRIRRNIWYSERQLGMHSTKKLLEYFDKKKTEVESLMLNK